MARAGSYYLNPYLLVLLLSRPMAPGAGAPPGHTRIACCRLGRKANRTSQPNAKHTPILSDAKQSTDMTSPKVGFVVQGNDEREASSTWETDIRTFFCFSQAYNVVSIPSRKRHSVHRFLLSAMRMSQFQTAVSPSVENIHHTSTADGFHITSILTPKRSYCLGRCCTAHNAHRSKIPSRPLQGWKGSGCASSSTKP
jgi:hypothetical protein